MLWSKRGNNKRKILHFLLHDIYLTAFVASYFENPVPVKQN